MKAWTRRGSRPRRSTLPVARAGGTTTAAWVHLADLAVNSVYSCVLSSLSTRASHGGRCTRHTPLFHNTVSLDFFVCHTVLSIKSQGLPTNSRLLASKITLCFLQLTHQTAPADVAAPEIGGGGRASAAWRRCPRRALKRAHGQLKLGVCALLGAMSVLVSKKINEGALPNRLYRYRNTDLRCASPRVRAPRTRSPTRAWSLKLGLRCLHTGFIWSALLRSLCFWHTKRFLQA